MPSTLNFIIHFLFILSPPLTLSTDVSQNIHTTKNYIFRHLWNNVTLLSFSSILIFSAFLLSSPHFFRSVSGKNSTKSSKRRRKAKYTAERSVPWTLTSQKIATKTSFPSTTPEWRSMMATRRSARTTSTRTTSAPAVLRALSLATMMSRCYSATLRNDATSPRKAR